MYFNDDRMSVRTFLLRGSGPRLFSKTSCFPGLLSGRKTMREKLWRDFFADPSQWWDHRLEKVNPRYPDFKHKKTPQSLWLIDDMTPAWVELELARMAPGLLESHIFAWHVRLRKHVKAGNYRTTLDLFEQMQREGIVVDKFTFVPVINACSNLRSLEEGRRVHAQIVQRGLDSDIYIANCLVDMYAKCGTVEDAWSVFKKMQERDVISWSSMIGGYVKSEQGMKAMGLFREMRQKGVKPNAITFVGVLNACASLAALEEGRWVHEEIIRRGCTSNVFVANCLVDMYAKCGSIEDAWNVFNQIHERNVVSWTAMIGVYVKSKQGLKALKLFQEMQEEGVEPNSVTFATVLNACASVGAFEQGKHVHEQIIQRGCEADVYVANCLIDMYAKCGSIVDAWTVFNKMPMRNVVSWSAMIGGYVKSGQGLNAVKLFRKMQNEGLEPDRVIFVGVLNACASVAALEEGRLVHQQIIQTGCESDGHVATSLVDMYAKCRSIEDAWSMFNKMQERDVVSWGAMIGGFVKSGQGLKAIELFRKMQKEGLEPDKITFVGVLNACASVMALEEGRRVHGQIIQRGCESDVYVADCLVDMYAKCGSNDDAWSVFEKMPKHGVISWNAMIAVYLKSRQGLKAMELFRRMQQEGVEPNTVTFVGALRACGSVAALEEGRRIHEEIVRRGCDTDVCVANCLVDMYAKCGSIEDACSVFNMMGERTLVSWTAMIRGYAMHGHAKKAIILFKQMLKEDVELDGVTFICLLSACSHGGLVKEGLRYFKSMTLCYDIFPTTEHYTCMIDLLGRAGWLEEAEEMTKRLPIERNASLWMSLLGACRVYGNIKMAERAAKMCLEVDSENASGHVLLSNAYAATGKGNTSAAIEQKQ